MGTGILLEAGTNEMELLVFRVGDTDYGINVAKVKELIGRQKTSPVPNAPDCIEGSFILRDTVLQLVDLARFLNEAPAEAGKHEKLIIVVEFNKLCCGVLVDSVEMIHRLSWDQIEPPSPFILSLGVPVTAVTKIDDRVVLILDFETIIGGLFGDASVHTEKLADPVDGEHPAYGEVRVLTVDDSPTIRMSLKRILEKAGFTNLTLCGDGQEAWELLQKEYANQGKLPFDLILTDIEMPRMDGLHLTKNIKEHGELRRIPVVLFSSLIREETANKGNAVGADGQITKFETEELLSVIDKCLPSRAG